MPRQVVPGYWLTEISSGRVRLAIEVDKHESYAEKWPKHCLEQAERKTRGVECLFLRAIPQSLENDLRIGRRHYQMKILAD